MNKEIKDRLDKLENELKESKNEIHSLKSSVSLTIERGIRKLLSRFTRKQLILGSVIALFLISIIGIAGTVTKTYTFSSGDVVSASKINTNFDTLFTLVNGNLDDNNISSISASKISDTVSIVDGSADGYMKFGNMLIVWGNGTTEGNSVAKTVNFPVSFSETPSVTANTIYSRSEGNSSDDLLRINAVTKSTTSIYIKASRNFHYIAVGKWQ